MEWDADVEAGVVVGPEALAQLVGIHRGVAAVAGVGVGGFAVPVVVEPSCARAPAAVDVEFDPAGDQAVVAGGLVGAGEGGEALSVVANLLDRAVLRAPQREDADRQVAVREHVRVGVPRPLSDPGILAAGHALGVEGVGQRADALALLVRAEPGDETRDESHRGFLEHAGGLTGGVAVDGASRRIGCVPGDPRHLERNRVGRAVVPHRVHQPDGPALVDLVQIRRVDVAHLLQLALVPATAPHPLPLAHGRGLFGHHPLHVRDVLDVRVAHVEVVETVRASAREVHMRVHQPGGDRASRQIDALGPGTHHRLDLRRRPHGDHALAPHRNRFGHAALRVEGDDGAARQDEIRLRLGFTGASGHDHARRQGGERCRPAIRHQ